MLNCSPLLAQVNGWRGDGSGKYPAANPPVVWSRVSVAMKEVRFCAEKPQGPDAGQTMADGVVREWLIAGPVVLDAPLGDAVPKEALAEPKVGEALGAAIWRKIAVDTSYVDFKRLLGMPPADHDVVAYALTHVFSPSGGAFRIDLSCAGRAALWVNGKSAKLMAGRVTFALEPGWNRMLLRVIPGEKDWYAAPVMHARPPCEYEQSGILWRMQLPETAPGFYGGGMGVGSPVIVGERMYLPSDPHDMICLNKMDGKVLWLSRASYFEAATDVEKKRTEYAEAAATAAKIDAINSEYIGGRVTAAQLLEKFTLERSLRKQMKLVDPEKYANREIPDVGFAGFTPCTDGKFIYAWFGDGVSACWDLEGHRRWMRIDQRVPCEHGFSSSPLLIDGKFVIFMRDLIAMDAASGKGLWQVPITAPTGPNPDNYFHGALIGAEIGGVKVILLGNGMIVRAADGAIVWKDKFVGKQFLVSPVVEKNEEFTITRYNRDLAIRALPAQFTDPLQLKSRAVQVDWSGLAKNYVDWELSSPLVHDGLAYLVNNAGALTVVDVAEGKVVYQKMLDLDIFNGVNEGAARGGMGISPILAGNRLYFIGGSGTTLVVAPGREYRQIAKNKLENALMSGHWSERQERFVANPVPEGDRIYIRGEQWLYAIGEVARN